MKRFVLTLTAFFPLILSAQDGVGINTETIEASAIFQIESNDKGLLIPRMSYAQRLAIASPAEGLLVYQNSGTTGFYYFDGGSWQYFGDDLDWVKTPSFIYTNEGLNVGIGTTTPDTDFHISSTDNLSVKLQRESASDTASIDFYRSTGTGSKDASILVNSNEELVFKIHEADADMKFIVNDGGVEKQLMYFDASNSKIGFNITSVPQELIHADGVIRANSGFKGNNGTSATPTYRFYNDGNSGMYIVSTSNLGFSTASTLRLQIDASGNTLPGADNVYTLGSSSLRFNVVYTANGILLTSDSTFKRNIIPLKYGLAEVKQLAPVSFNWKQDLTNETKLGFVAQEVEEIIPEVVEKSEEGNYSMNYSELIPVLVNAIKELEKRVSDLEAENIALKTLSAER